MDLDSWQPRDIARRLATVVASLIGVTAFLALWLGLPTHFLLAMLGGGGLGFLSFLLVHPLLRAFYR
ncbi:hypothetical protein [Deinococcus fonticola]|uniref:hypothetical protein n=1 Tax=Deinococcus fonticola TaxID=2528713 RepID=UPI001075244D|nr:hypothetical protein [Deinococcus fonticola]